MFNRKSSIKAALSVIMASFLFCLSLDKFASAEIIEFEDYIGTQIIARGTAEIPDGLKFGDDAEVILKVTNLAKFKYECAFVKDKLLEESGDRILFNEEALEQLEEPFALQPNETKTIFLQGYYIVIS